MCWNFFYGCPKRCLKSRKRWKEISMVKLDIGDDENFGRKFEKVIAILARLDNEEIGLSGKKIGTKILDNRANDRRRLLVRRLQDRCEHTGRCCFSMRACNSNRPRGLGNLPKRLEIRCLRNTHLARPHALRITRWHCIAVDKKLGISGNIVSCIELACSELVESVERVIVPDPNSDTSLCQHRGYGGFFSIRAGDTLALMFEQLRKRRHAYATDPDHVYARNFPCVHHSSIS